VEFLQQLKGLLYNYYQQAFPFLVAHVALTVWVIYDSLYRKFRREIVALHDWRRGAPGKTEATSVLAQFVSSSEKWGRHGVLIPMTDFSDRLDSVADSIVEELHGRINLFLIIGIAGTFFGLFQFAVDAVRLLPETTKTGDLSLFAESFSKALAKAFPVGFVGLVLMVVGQFVASNRERALHNAMANAVRRAIDARDERFSSPVEALTLALKPLQSLDQVLTKSLTPVVEKLGEELKTSSDVLAGQFEVLKESVGAIQSSIQSLETVADRLKGLLEGAPALLSELHTLAQGWQNQVAALGSNVTNSTTSLQSASEGLQTAANRLQRIPDEFAAVTKTELENLIEGSSRIWLEISQKFFGGFQLTLSQLMVAVHDSSAEACNSLERAASELQTVANTVKSSIESSTTAAINGVADEARKTLAGIDDTLRQKFPEAIRNLRETAAASTELVTSMAGATAGANAVAEGVANVANSLATMNKQLCDYITQLGSISPAQNGSGETVKDIAEKLKTALQQFVSISDSLYQVNRTASVLQHDVSGIASRVRRQPRKMWHWMMYGRNAE
jgi:ABC-type transporter Mla subunit MlaD